VIRTLRPTLLRVPAQRASAWRSRVRRPLFGALLIGFGLSACTVGPFYRKPQVAPPAAWRESDTGAAVVGTGSASPEGVPMWPASQWWQGFKSPQLDDLMSQAQKANDDLAAAVARVREADAQVRIAGAPLFPSLQAAGTATRERTKPANAPSGAPAT